MDRPELSNGEGRPAALPAASAYQPTGADLPESLCWPDRPTDADLAPLPGVPAVYLLVDGAGRPVLLATTQHLRRLAISRLTDPDRPKTGKADLAEIVRGVRWRPVLAPFEGRWWYYRLARRMYPRDYRRLVGFGPAWFLHIDWQRPVPEPRVSERVWRDPGAFIGPWPARTQCQQALEGLWDLFDLCRHPEQVRRTPHGERCAYAEMGRCDAPCDGSVPLTAYTERCRRAWAFAAGGVADWIAATEDAMRAAAAELAFERAGLLKQQLAFARKWQSDWTPRVRPLERLNFLLCVAATRRKAWKLFLLREGVLSDGPVLPDRKLAAGAVTWLRACLAPETAETPPAEAASPAPPDQPAAPAEPAVTTAHGAGDDTVRMEQTWLVAHLLQHREADTAIIVPLPESRIPDHLHEALSDELTARRRKPQPPTGDDAP
jgi:DNA polymerase-3 subunit epsilon